MAWYKAGTVSVTNGSATVTGSGTAFVGNVKIGEAFAGPDGRAYEIADVVSNTVLALARTYTGSTAAAQNYAILPTQSLMGDVVVRIDDLLTSFAGVRDGIGQGLFPDGTVGAPALRFAADQDSGLYRKGSNSIGVSVGAADVLVVKASGVEAFGSGSEGLRAKGAVCGGAGSNSTGGVTAFTIDYETGHRVANIGSLRGSSALAFGYAVQPSPAAADAWVSSASNANWARSGMSLGGTSFSIGFAAAQTTAVGTAVALTTRFVVETTGVVRPGIDNSQTLGSSGARWSTIYAGTGTINTSDERDKVWRGVMSANEYAAGKRIIDELGFFQWNDSVEEKGAADARLHFGVRAQAVWGIMQDCGLAGAGGESIKYGFLCYDEWDEEVEASQVAIAAGNRYGIRPDQLALFLIAVQARRQSELRARIEALEA